MIRSSSIGQGLMHFFANVDSEPELPRSPAKETNSQPLSARSHHEKSSSNGLKESSSKRKDTAEKNRQVAEKMMQQFTTVEAMLDRKDCKALLDWAGSLSKHANNLTKEGKGMEVVADKLFHMAEQNYEQAMKLEPQNKRVFFDWGKTLLRLAAFLEKQKNLQEAYRQYKQASSLLQFGLDLGVAPNDIKILRYWMKAIEKLTFFRPSDKSIAGTVDAFLKHFHAVALLPEVKLESSDLSMLTKISLSENKYIKSKGIVILRQVVSELPKGTPLTTEAEQFLQNVEAILHEREQKPQLKFEDLPEECKHLVAKSGLSIEEITQKGHFDVFLNCLWFENQKMKRRVVPESKDKAANPTAAHPAAAAPPAAGATATPTTDKLAPPQQKLPDKMSPNTARLGDPLQKRLSMPTLNLAKLPAPGSDSAPKSPRLGSSQEAFTIDIKELFVHKNPQNLFRSFLQIGQGAYGEVYTARHVKRDEQVAIKVMHVKNPRDMKHICNEIYLLKSCNHPNIVNYLESYYYDYTVWMVMKYYNGGTLQHLLRNVELAEHEMKSISRQILEGLKYLHTKNLVHRDIKSENILLSSDGVIVIADLGFCAQLTTALETPMPISGSSYWIAPEMLRHEPYGCKVDIWSFGCVLVEMAERRPPYGEYRALKAIYYTATRGAPRLRTPTKYSPEFIDLLENALQFDQDCRPSADELLKHAFYQEKKEEETKAFVKGHRRTRSNIQ